MLNYQRVNGDKSQRIHGAGIFTYTPKVIF